MKGGEIMWTVLILADAIKSQKHGTTNKERKRNFEDFDNKINSSIKLLKYWYFKKKCVSSYIGGYKQNCTSN